MSEPNTTPIDFEDDTPLACPLRDQADDQPCEGCQ